MESRVVHIHRSKDGTYYAIDVASQRRLNMAVYVLDDDGVCDPDLPDDPGCQWEHVIPTT